jgi:cell fate regulator YaaT (PSP1 superfamily)
MDHKCTPCTSLADNKQTIAACWLAKLDHTNETFIVQLNNPNELSRGMRIVVQSKYGLDLATVIGPAFCDRGGEDTLPLIRFATEQDVEEFNSHQEKEHSAAEIFRNKVEEHQLEMKLVSAHYLLGEHKILFFFTSERRVDFRNLVRDLVNIFHARIELRQIGVRDESRMVGGRGVCGRCLCCNQVSDSLQPVSIKMAKVQSLSLNSMKISGPCGRLLCCLAYEYDVYQEERRGLPNEGQWLYSEDRRYRIGEVNILAKRLLVFSGEGHCITVAISDVKYDTTKRQWVSIGNIE